MPIKAVAFDAYGTLFDVYSVQSLAEDIFPGHGQQIAFIWRDQQINYTRLMTLSGRYENFWHVTGEALRHACEILGLHINEASFDRLMRQYAELQAFPENREVLLELRKRGIATAILSNGNYEMLDAALQASDLSDALDFVISVDSVQKYKTASEAYQLGPDTFNQPASDILFVSSNGWDVCGATWFGYTTFWVNRAGNVLERLGVKPAAEGQNLKDILTFLDGKT